MTLDVCLAPGLYHLHAKDRQIVVVVDVVRMSTSICVAFEYGVESIVPVAEWQDAIPYHNKGYLISGERNSYQLEGFDLGNSPYDFMTDSCRGRKLAMSTTNGTYAIDIATHAMEIWIASFINFDALITKLLNCDANILLLCAGWNRRVNAEDSLFAGAVVHALKEKRNYTIASDAVLMVEKLYLQAPSRFDWVIANSHRFSEHLDRLEKDIRFCLEPPYQLEFLPYLSNGKIIV